MSEIKYFLETQRLGFRIWTTDDLDLAIGLWGDYEVTKLFDGRGPLFRDQIQHRLLAEIATQAYYGIQYWPMFHKKTGEHVGCAGLRPYDLPENVLEIGFHIRSKFWRQGYAFEAATEIVNYAFKIKQVSELFAGHNPKNSASRNLLVKLGFQYTHDEYYEPTGLQHPSYILTNESYAKLKKK
jgi:RimJ/RimL family protein N-acetyltransferase